MRICRSLFHQRKLTTNFAIGELFRMGVEVVDARHKFGDLRIGIRGRAFLRFTRGVGPAASVTVGGNVYAPL